MNIRMNAPTLCKATALAAGALALLPLGPVRPALADPPGDSSAWTQTFDDEFDGDSLDTGKWNTTWINGGTTTGWSQERMYPENVTVSGGACHIMQWCNPNRHSVYNGVDYGPANESGVLTTWGGGKFHQTYGYYEARIKAAPGDGLLSAFWMSNEDHWPPEIDFEEILGRYPQDVFLTQHWGVEDSNGQHPYDQTDWNAGTDLTSGYHTYGCDWEPDQIVWYVDGVERKRMANNVNDPMYLELNIHAGNSWAGYPDTSDPTQHFMDIDYVRVWRRN
jgi:beta-glucanase (GH16 family)